MVPDRSIDLSGRVVDDGPILGQDIERISLCDTTEELVSKSRDIDRIVLARAVYFHAEHWVLLNGKKTIVFD